MDLTKRTVLKRAAQICRHNRIINGWTVTDVARATGYTVGTISQFEHGKNNNLYLYLFYEWGLNNGDQDSAGSANSESIH